MIQSRKVQSQDDEFSRGLKDLAVYFFIRLITIINILIDASFLVAWCFITFYVEKFSNRLVLNDSINQSFSDILDWSFAISTLLPILFFISKDIWKSFKQAWGNGGQKNGN